MTTKDFILRIRDDLRSWASAQGGTVEIAGDAVDVFGMLQTKPGGLRAVVWIAREAKRGEFEEAGLVDRTVHVFVSRGRGFALQPSDTLIRPTGGAAKPLYDLVEEVRDVVRGIDMNTETTEVTLDYRGFRPFEMPTDRPVDAYQLEFMCGVQLPGLSVYLAYDDDGSPLLADDEGTLLAA